MYLPFLLLQNIVKKEKELYKNSQIYEILLLLEEYYLKLVSTENNIKWWIYESKKRELVSFIKYVKFDIEIYKLLHYNDLKQEYIFNNKNLDIECKTFINSIDLKNLNERDIYYLLIYYKKYFSSEIILDMNINNNWTFHFKEFLINLFKQNKCNWHYNKFNIDSLIFSVLEEYITIYGIDYFIKNLNKLVFSNIYLSLQFLTNYVKILNIVDTKIRIPNNTIEKRISHILKDNPFSILSNEEVLTYYSS